MNRERIGGGDLWGSNAEASTVLQSAHGSDGYGHRTENGSASLNSQKHFVAAIAYSWQES
jgi:hypothetical protein